MRQPGRFTSAVSFSTPVMSVAYLALGAIGYWSQGMGVQEIIIFGTGYDTWSRIAAGAILFQVNEQSAVRAPSPSVLFGLQPRGNSGALHPRPGYAWSTEI